MSLDEFWNLTPLQLQERLCGGDEFLISAGHWSAFMQGQRRLHPIDHYLATPRQSREERSRERDVVSEATANLMSDAELAAEAEQLSKTRGAPTT